MPRNWANSIVLACILLLPRVLSSQSLSWVQIGVGNGISSVPALAILDLKADSEGNLIVVGACSFVGNQNSPENSFAFADTILKALPAKTGSLYYVAFVAKLDKSGHLLWLQSTKGDYPSESGGGIITHVEVDQFDAIYFSGWMDEHTSIGDFPKDILPGKQPQTFIAKTSPDGKLLWIQTFVKSPDVRSAWSGEKFKVATDGTLYLYGVLQQQSLYEFFIFQVDVSGTILRRFSAPTTIAADYHIAPGTSGQVYAKYQTTEKSFRLLEFDANLTTVRESSFHSSSSYGLNASDVLLGSDGYLYICGNGKDSIFIDNIFYASLSQPTTAFILKLDKDFRPVWIKTNQPTNASVANAYRLFHVKGDIYLLGIYSQFLDFGEYAATANSDSWFLARFSSDGSNKGIPITVPTQSTYSYPIFYIDDCSNVYWAGGVKDSLKWGPIHLDFVQSNQLAANGVFIAKFTWDSIKYKNISTSCGILSLENASTITGAQYYWISNGRVLDTSFNLSYSFPKSGRYPVSLVAIKSDGCASVFTDSVDYIKPEIDLSAEISCVSTIGDSLEITFTSNPKASFYHLYKQGNNGNWVAIAKTKATTIREILANPGEVYNYRLKLEDSCHNLSEYSAVISNIAIQGKTQGDQCAELSWNKGSASTNSWEIQRKDLRGMFQTIASTNQTDYKDFEFYQTRQSSSCYRIIARSPVCEALSQMICLPYPVRLYLPNCFTPNSDSLNQVYKPVATNIISYELTIYNRWGEHVFETRDLQYGWDGTIRGQRAPEGLYRYFLRARGSDYSQISRSGYFTLIR